MKTNSFSSLAGSAWQQLRKGEISFGKSVKEDRDITSPEPSAWQRLKRKEISLELAQKLLVDDEGDLNLDLLDSELYGLFLQRIPEHSFLPPVTPLLLWGGCYYLGSPIIMSEVEAKELGERIGANVKIIVINKKSYRNWFRLQNIDSKRFNFAPLANSLDEEEENISEVAELYFSQAKDQFQRIKTIISHALNSRASDIHLEPNNEGLLIRFRIDGILRDIITLPLEVSRKVVVAIKVMCDMDIAESRRPQDGRIGEKYEVDDGEECGLDLRVSTLPCVSGRQGEIVEKVVLRLLRQQNTFSTIEGIGFSEHSCAIYKSWLRQPQGMIIYTGPTGSGKTSTLYTSLQAIATQAKNIVTVEDPVEYIMPRVTQTQVNEASGMTFAAGLRSILRQDPDIIMVGEIRDTETAETAVRAALTGHLVLTTLHTNDAISTIPRLRDIGPDSGLVSDALLGIVAQRLVRKVCPHCAAPHIPTKSELRALGLTPTSSTQGWRKGKGCPKCFSSGYFGREAIIEVLNVNQTMRQLIYKGDMTEIQSYLEQTDFESFRKAAIAKIQAGITTVEEILRVLPDSAIGGDRLESEFNSIEDLYPEAILEPLLNTVNHEILDSSIKKNIGDVIEDNRLESQEVYPESKSIEDSYPAVMLESSVNNVNHEFLDSSSEPSVKDADIETEFIVGTVYDEIVNDLKKCDNFIRTAKLLSYLSSGEWVSDENKLNLANLSDRIQQVQELNPTLEKLKFTLLEVVKTLNKKAEYSKVAKHIFQNLRRLYPQLPMRGD